MISYHDLTTQAIILPKLYKDPKWVALRDLGPRMANFCTEVRPASDGVAPRPAKFIKKIR